MTILLTGAEGFVGSHLKASVPCEVVPFSFSRGEIDAIDFSGIDAVVHLGGVVHRMSAADDAEYFRVNRDRTAALARRAREAGVKTFLFMSTVKVYGETSDAECFDEESPCAPADPYGKSKLEAEVALRALQDDRFAVSIIRTPVVYGPGVKANILALIRMVEKLPLLPLGGIRNRRSLVYVGNLAALVEQILVRNVSGIFLASDGAPLSTSKLVGLIASAFGGRKPIVTVPFLGAFLKKFRPAFYERLYGTLCVDASATNALLGFAPPYSAEAGWKETVAWYRELHASGDVSGR